MKINDDNKNDLGSSRKEEVYVFFDELGIAYEAVEHPPLFTQADNEKLRPNIGAVIFKNLFLRNKNKSSYYLLSLPLEKKADLPALQRLLEESRLSFGDETALMEKLHIRPGSVSLLNPIGAMRSDITFIIDDTVFDYEKFGVHPNDNTATIIFSPKDLPKLLNAIGVTYRFVKL
jgi:Ala-tRNA(Pro) deacylase